MAASIPPAHAHPFASQVERTESSPKRALPSGPCNYRDQSLGGCGCTQFWDKFSADYHEGSHRFLSDTERSTWCVCGHHACFHLHDASFAAERSRPVAPLQLRRHATHDGRAQSVLDAQWEPQVGGSSVLRGGGVQESQRSRLGHFMESQYAQDQGQAGCGAIPSAGDAHNAAPKAILSPSGLPRLPSICLLSSERREREEEDRMRAVDPILQSTHPFDGLGFAFDHMRPRQASVSSTVVSEINHVPQMPLGAAEMSPTQPNAIPGASDQIFSHISAGPMTQIMEFNRTLHANVPGDTIPDTFNPNEVAQSATDVATPSNPYTPDFGQIDQAVQDTRKLVETLTRLTNQPEGHNSQRPGSNAEAAGAAPQPSNPTSTSPQEQLHQVVRAGSPQILQRLVSYLNPLHNLLKSMPNLASTVRDLNSRLDHLENYSFNPVQPEDFQQQLEAYDGRILELEHRMDEHDELHKAIDADRSTSSGGNHVAGSFTSTHSNQSLSGATRLIGREELATEFEGIKDRLDLLEAAAMPSLANPWDIEVIFLPWGPGLRGIWYSPDQPMHDPAKPMTQDSEEWTQGLRSSQRARSSSANPQSSDPPSHGTLSLTSSLGQSEAESGWSSQAIGDWMAGEEDEWLFPKACGSNNLVYKRLQSRGFVRNITLHNSSARDIQRVLSKAFGELSAHLKYTEGDNNPSIEAYPGLRASFIPLRKVLKESRLHFLTPAEMSSSALWSASFLSSGVMMRVSGGKRRLYVTQREAYLQENPKDETLFTGELPRRGSSWSWQDIRELPRFHPDPEPVADADSKMEGAEEQGQPEVPEADAKEACWAFVEAFDLTPVVSSNSSFNSNNCAPVQLSMRPADREWRRSMTPNSILKNRHQHPISPQSELRSLRSAQKRGRTVSASAIEESRPISNKRRLKEATGKPSSSSGSSARMASAASRAKRQRMTAPSSLPQQLEYDTVFPGQDCQMVLYRGAPPVRHYDGPPSPFTSSHPTLTRTNSDAASRPSQRSANLVRTPLGFPYATPHSEISAIPYNTGGDTEPDTDYGDDDDNDDEGSWHGMATDDDVAHGDDERDIPATAKSRDHGESIPVLATSSVLIWDSDTGYSSSDASPFASDDDEGKDELEHASDGEAGFEEDRYADDVDMDSDYAFGYDRHGGRYEGGFGQGAYHEQRTRRGMKRFYRERERERGRGEESSGHDVLDTLLNVLQSD